ncbi:MAG: hypothetical protein CMM61_07740 [Rhodospirillaceae bacterium]|nr:hypothetical protein [Rhodospirillaceae bacterium]|tara:strand:- start:3353 stop:4183 length:831 start_codon:yes stop_codon:yes gene_type:complete
MITNNATPFAYTFANTQLAGQRVAFELQFTMLQNSLINNYNKEVEELAETPRSVEIKIEQLQKRATKLVDSLPALESFRQGNANNMGALEAIFEEVTTLFQTFNQDATVDADEVAAFEAQRDRVAEKIENLYLISHPDVNDANVIKNLKADLDTIRSLELTEGALTDNSDVADTLASLQTEVSIAITVTKNTVATTLDLEQKIQTEFATVEADLYELTTKERDRRELEISNLETDLGNLLRAISVSFEINSGLSDALAARLKPQVPPPGSAVNIIS